MISTKRTDHLAFMHEQNRRDSGNYSECYSEISEQQKNCKRGDVKVEAHDDITRNGSFATADISGDDVVSKDETNLDAKSEELEHLLPILGAENCRNRNIESYSVHASDDIKTDYAGHDFEGTHSNKYYSPLEDSPLHKIKGTHQAQLKNHNVDVINRKSYK